MLSEKNTDLEKAVDLILKRGNDLFNCPVVVPKFTVTPTPFNSPVREGTKQIHLHVETELEKKEDDNEDDQFEFL
jgi:hypothetical protein